uniref:Uncharacterized protein n=1 Tax=Oryza meridionalis TaxID=40149 RepID=A0A0E0E1S4_9ORYZ
MCPADLIPSPQQIIRDKRIIATHVQKVFDEMLTARTMDAICYWGLSHSKNVNKSSGKGVEYCSLTARDPPSSQPSSPISKSSVCISFSLDHVTWLTNNCEVLLN